MTNEEIDRKIAELEEQKQQAEISADIQDTQQHAYKIFLNSIYGFTGTAFSPVFNKDIAEGVTLTGQATIKEMAKYVNGVLNEISENRSGEDDWVIAGDTDSVSGDTMIDVNGNQMTIEDAFNCIDGRIDVLKNGTEVKVFPDDAIKTISICNDGYTGIKNISRHKVNKKMFRVTTPDGKQLELTEDHSLVVLDENGNLVERRPEDLKTTDQLIVLQ